MLLCTGQHVSMYVRCTVNTVGCLPPSLHLHTQKFIPTSSCRITAQSAQSKGRREGGRAEAVAGLSSGDSCGGTVTQNIIIIFDISCGGCSTKREGGREGGPRRAGAGGGRGGRFGGRARGSQSTLKLSREGPMGIYNYMHTYIYEQF